MTYDEIPGALDNLLFAAGDSMGIPELAEIFGMEFEEFSSFIDAEIEKRLSGSGLIIKKFGNRIQLATNEKYSGMINDALGSKDKNELSRAMLETLSIIAYKQPVTKSEVDEIRGVNSGYTVNSLLTKGLIAEAGRKKAIGMPMLYVTTENFLRHMGISDLSELPEPDLESVNGTEENNNA